MVMQGEHIGLKLFVEGNDLENLEFFRYCGKHDFHLQKCTRCGLLRYPPSTGCPWCANLESEWVPVEPKGTVHSYEEVHHAIIPNFQEYLPYLTLLVDLDTQKGQPTEFEALRVTANLVTPEGRLAPPELVRQVGVGSRVRMVYLEVGEDFAIPQWTLDEEAEQPETPWRYPQE